MSDTVTTQEELLDLLDALFRKPAPWWDKFYQDRTKDIPFFIDAPDENLVAYFEEGWLAPGKALELGCGPGRNAIYMAGQGCSVDAIDLSAEAIRWAEERAADSGLPVSFRCGDVFEVELEDGAYDLAYDSGLLHHLLPHRRMQYVELLARKLKSGGRLGLVCFAPGFEDAGCPGERPDAQVYRALSMQGGMAYSRERLELILSRHFELIDIRHMRDCTDSRELFGKPFLWSSLWGRK
ncbi:class I SAM-dependent methyltransferase [Paenibacillus chartarius]|uniref:Class I SAM-dependent methyltransferase n=1 Tax=Paenibacillus chartarius TaxID=747481 RepID=A0ABV6DSH3_9BACL